MILKANKKKKFLIYYKLLKAHANRMAPDQQPFLFVNYLNN